MSVLYIFNPEHDLALANGSPFFNAPLSAMQFAADCYGVLSWLFDDNHDVEGNISCCCSMLKNSDLSAMPITSVVPWGWDAALCYALQKAGVDNDVIPTATQISDIRMLSNRQTAIDALAYLAQRHSLDISVPKATDCTDDAVAEAKRYASVVYKMPWSGSGKGIRICRNDLTDNDIKWLQNVIDKQGAVVCERYHNVICNFAMEFMADDGIEFVGYSLFDVGGVGYKSSHLMSDRAIEHHLSQWIDISTLQLYKSDIMEYMSVLLRGRYKGYFGVDMYVYFEEGRYKLNPMVEINLRMTMGLVANILRKKMLCTDNQKLTVHYDGRRGAASDHHRYMQETYPLRYNDQGKIQSGYISLTQPTEHSHYNIYISDL